MIVTPEIAADILLITDYLKVKSLRSRRDLIMASLPIEQIVKIAVKTKGSSLKMYSTVFMELLHKFSSATKADNFFDMDVETYCQLLASGKVNLISGNITISTFRHKSFFYIK